MIRRAWLIATAAIVAVAAAAGIHFRNVQRPPAPSAARLPASARVLLQPSREDGLDLTVEPGGDRQYRIAMQAGATLVYSWAADLGPVSYQFADQNPGRARDAHGAFVAQSTGWYRWRWTNPSGRAVTIHLKLRGYYEPPGMPYDR